MTEPIKRRPGRPRKHPLPVPETPATSTEEAETPAPEAPKPAPSDSKDPRIGLECHPTASHVGFDDGSLYEAQDGYVVKRVD